MRLFGFFAFCFLMAGAAFASQKKTVLPFIPYVGAGDASYVGDNVVVQRRFQPQPVSVYREDAEYKKVATFIYGTRQDYLGKRELAYVKMLADRLKKNPNLYVLIRTYYVPNMDDFDYSIPSYRLSSIVDPLTDLGVAEYQIRTDIVTKKRPLFSPHRVEIFVK